MFLSLLQTYTKTHKETNNSDTQAPKKNLPPAVRAILSPRVGCLSLAGENVSLPPPLRGDAGGRVSAPRVEDALFEEITAADEGLDGRSDPLSAPEEVHPDRVPPPRGPSDGLLYSAHWRSFSRDEGLSLPLELAPSRVLWLVLGCSVHGRAFSLGRIPSECQYGMRMLNIDSLSLSLSIKSCLYDIET
jgi:hypothetical protein